MNQLVEKKEELQTFIEEWLHHFNLQYEKNCYVKKDKIGLNYYLPKFNLGVIISDKSKPVNVTAINKAIKTLNHFKLTDLFIVTSKISDNAYDTINRLPINLSVVHPFALSNLAMKFVNYSKSSTVKVN
ncbi:MAG: hypothetical protein ACC656_03745 [Candidatus Heimdallarchaeota archaeon]